MGDETFYTPPERWDADRAAYAADENDGIDAVVSAISDISGSQYQNGSGPKLERLTTGEEAYAAWLRDKSRENMSKVLAAYAPTINSEITRYSGPKTLLRSRAKILAIKAIKTFNPMSGARLNSWVVTNLKPLSRYGIQQRDVKIPEVAARQAAAVNAATERLKDELGRDPTDEELADETGMNAKRVRDVRAKAVASVNSGMFDEAGDDDFSGTPGVVTPSQLPFAQDVVYHDLSPEDRFIYDAALGAHGVPKTPAVEVARQLGISPAAVSQRAKAIGKQIEYVVNNV